MTKPVIDWEARRALRDEAASIASRSGPKDNPEDHAGSNTSGGPEKASVSPESPVGDPTAVDDPEAESSGHEKRDKTEAASSDGSSTHKPTGDVPVVGGKGQGDDLEDLPENKPKVKKVQFATQITTDTDTEYEQFLKDEDLVKTSFTEWCLKRGMADYKRIKRQRA